MEDMEKHIEQLRVENEQLKKQQKKREKWIEKDEQLAAKPAIGRLVTKKDIDNPKFMEKYPNARIGDELNDPEPLRWKIGLKRKPTHEEIHAQVAAQFARDVRDEIGDETLDSFDDFSDYDEGFTDSEVNAFLHQSALQDARSAEISAPEGNKQTSLSPAKQSAEGTNGGEATAQQPVPPSGSEGTSE